MEEVTCPRCQGKGDIPSPSGEGATQCFACGGRGVIDKVDLEWKSKWKAEKTPEAKPKRAPRVGRATEERTVPQKRATTTKKIVPPSMREETGRTPLHDEASDGFIRGVKDLLEGGADANARDKDGRTPLHWPAYRGHIEIVRLLIEHGADVNAKDNSGRTPLKMATIGNHTDVIALLQEHGATV